MKDVAVTSWSSGRGIRTAYAAAIGIAFFFAMACGTGDDEITVERSEEVVALRAELSR